MAYTDNRTSKDSVKIDRPRTPESRRRLAKNEADGVDDVCVEGAAGGHDSAVF